MELHLIRHGQTNWNEEGRAQGQSDSRLTEVGEQQAIALGKRISHLKFDKVFCSSSLRTRQTADLVFPRSKSDIEYLNSLREIFLGPWVANQLWPDDRPTITCYQPNRNVRVTNFCHFCCINNIAE